MGFSLPNALVVGAGPRFLSRPHTSPGLMPGSATALELAVKLIFKNTGTLQPLLYQLRYARHGKRAELKTETWFAWLLLEVDLPGQVRYCDGRV